MSDAPGEPLPPRIQKLERDLREHPEADWLYHPLLGAFCEPDLYRHPRRIELILELITRFPRSGAAQCSIAHPDPKDTPEAFRAVEALWLRLRSEHPDDPALAIGHAALVANDDQPRAAEILRAAIALLPDKAELWMELGRIAPEAAQSLDAFQKARALGSDHPNLLVWTGRAAARAGRSDVFSSVGSELIARARQTRDTVSPPIGWDDTGRDAWERLRAALDDSWSPDDGKLIHAVGQHANDTHWGHTFLGLAAAEQGQLREASQHLLSSANVIGEPRLYSYGPSCLLAQKLCDAGQWKDVEQYLIACKDLWESDLLDEWLEDVRNQRGPKFNEP